MSAAVRPKKLRGTQTEGSAVLHLDPGLCVLYGVSRAKVDACEGPLDADGFCGRHSARAAAIVASRDERPRRRPRAARNLLRAVFRRDMAARPEPASAVRRRCPVCQGLYDRGPDTSACPHCSTPEPIEP